MSLEVKIRPFPGDFACGPLTQCSANVLPVISRLLFLSLLVDLHGKECCCYFLCQLTIK